MMSRKPAGHVPLDRALSKLGLASRAEAKQLIADGRVSVNGRVVHNIATLVVPERARIAIDGAGRNSHRGQSWEIGAAPSTV